MTNPPIDPLREPMETRVFLGKKPDDRCTAEAGTDSLCTEVPPQLELSVPVLFSAMSYGSISYNAHASLARAAEQLGHLLQHRRRRTAPRISITTATNTIVQVASGRFGVA